MADLYEFPDRQAMAAAAAAAIAARLTAAIAARGRATLSLSGGSTPAAAYRALAHADLDWSRVVLTLSDERWIPPAAAESNERLIRQTLLQHKAKAARFIGLYMREDASEAVAEIEDALSEAPRPIDLGVLGVGEDGHTASLFAGAEEGPLSPRARGRVAAVAKDGPGASRSRITMTLPELASHAALIVLAHGMQKRAIIDAVLGISGDPQGLPIAHVVAAARGPVDFYWAP